MGPKGQWVEVQIRSQRMNEIAEKGYAAHYKYKHNEEKSDDNMELWLSRLQEALENNATNAVDFVEQFKLNLYAKEIFVFTPNGDLKSLPKGSTALDFAFHVHTDIGLTTRGTRVNGKLTPLSRVLKSGDQVEVITSSSAKPTSNWLDFVTTGRARSKIKTALKETKKQIAEDGKEILRRKLRSQKIQMSETTINELVNHFKLKTSLDLFYRVGNGNIDNKEIKEFASQKSNALVSFFKSKIRRASKPQTTIDDDEISSNYDQLVFGDEEEAFDYTLSKCCNPIPGDEVFGFLTVNDGIKVHKKDCPNAIQLQSNYAYRIQKAKWIDSTQEDFSANLKLSGIDNMGLVSQITDLISKSLHVNMKKLNFNTNHGIFEGEITVNIKNKKILTQLIDRLKKIDGIDKVSRE